MGQSESRIVPLVPNVMSASDILADAEKKDGYLAAIQNNSINSRARSENVYAPFGDEFSDVEQNDNQFPKGVIISMMPSADSGFPHTRGDNVICIPAYYPREKLKHLLIHERIHLAQKANRSAYDNFYKTQWGFKENHYAIPENILKLTRINPDTIGWPIYIWRDTWIPLCLFEREDKPSLRECSYCWYNPKGGVLLKKMPPAWRDFFGTVGQSEHPNELSACYGADYEDYKDVEAARLFYSFLFTKQEFYRGNSSRLE